MCASMEGRNVVIHLVINIAYAINCKSYNFALPNN